MEPEITLVLGGIRTASTGVPGPSRRTLTSATGIGCIATASPLPQVGLTLESPGENSFLLRAGIQASRAAWHLQLLVTKYPSTKQILPGAHRVMSGHQALQHPQSRYCC